jgi:hypothetical protein
MSLGPGCTATSHVSRRVVGASSVPPSPVLYDFCYRPGRYFCVFLWPEFSRKPFKLLQRPRPSSTCPVATTNMVANGQGPSLRISNGEIVYINGWYFHLNARGRILIVSLDHVYVSPPWPHRDGIPYNIARIMEFLPDEGATRSRGKSRELFTRVRLAWYYRPSDLNDRPNADPRLLLAAIFSEVQPVSHLRAKCRVRHKDKIADLQVWKRKPDHFYFQRVFDPYIRKEFDVLRSADVTNCEICLCFRFSQRELISIPVPPEIRDVLQSRYEFVVAERDVIGDLTDTLRLCETCEKWAPS